MTPEDLKHFSAFLKEFQDETDRGAALVGASMIDARLLRLIRSHLLNKKIADDLLGANAPLGTFSARIKLAYALGLITRLEFNECDTVRRIRNAFAHELHGLSFDAPHIAALCNKLKANKPSGTDVADKPRSNFINSVVLVCLSLWYRAEHAAPFKAQERVWSYQLSE